MPSRNVWRCSGSGPRPPTFQAGPIDFVSVRGPLPLGPEQAPPGAVQECMAMLWVWSTATNFSSGAYRLCWRWPPSPVGGLAGPDVVHGAIGAIELLQLLHHRSSKKKEKISWRQRGGTLYARRWCSAVAALALFYALYNSIQNLMICIRFQ